MPPTSGPKNSGGVTPMILNGTRSIAIDCPIASRAPPNCRCQKPKLMTATGPSGPPPRVSSREVNVRPIIALTPITSKNAPLAQSPGT